MGDEELINQFPEVKECEYKGRHYLVRDNGAILRVTRRKSFWSRSIQFVVYIIACI